jgi:hypothetical protein
VYLKGSLGYGCRGYITGKITAFSKSIWQICKNPENKESNLYEGIL